MGYYHRQHWVHVLQNLHHGHITSGKSKKKGQSGHKTALNYFYLDLNYMFILHQICLENWPNLIN